MKAILLRKHSNDVKTANSQGKLGIRQSKRLLPLLITREETEPCDGKGGKKKSNRSKELPKTGGKTTVEDKQVKEGWLNKR